jgi:hypothetical protein
MPCSPRSAACVVVMCACLPNAVEPTAVAATPVTAGGAARRAQKVGATAATVGRRSISGTLKMSSSMATASSCALRPQVPVLLSQQSTKTLRARTGAGVRWQVEGSRLRSRVGGVAYKLSHARSCFPTCLGYGPPLSCERITNMKLLCGCKRCMRVRLKVCTTPQRCCGLILVD